MDYFIMASSNSDTIPGISLSRDATPPITLSPLVRRISDQLGCRGESEPFETEEPFEFKGCRVVSDDNWREYLFLKSEVQKLTREKKQFLAFLVDTAARLEISLPAQFELGEISDELLAGMSFQLHTKLLESNKNKNTLREVEDLVMLYRFRQSSNADSPPSPNENNTLFTQQSSTLSASVPASCTVALNSNSLRAPMECIEDPSYDPIIYIQYTPPAEQHSEQINTRPQITSNTTCTQHDATNGHEQWLSAMPMSSSAKDPMTSSVTLCSSPGMYSVPAEDVTPPSMSKPPNSITEHIADQPEKDRKETAADSSETEEGRRSRVGKMNSEWRHKCPKCQQCFYFNHEFVRHQLSNDCRKNKIAKQKRLHRVSANQLEIRQISEDSKSTHRIFLKTHGRNAFCVKLKDGSFQCQCCEKPYATKEGFDRHIKSKTEDWKFKCDECDLKFLELEDLKKHMYQSHKVSQLLRQYNFSCRECGRLFKKHKELLLHKGTVHNVDDSSYETSESVASTSSHEIIDSSCDESRSSTDKEPAVSPVGEPSPSGELVAKLPHTKRLRTRQEQHPVDSTQSMSQDHVSKKRLLHHSKDMSHAALYVCSRCNTPFNRLAKLKAHMKTHGSRNTGLCAK